MKDRQLLVAGAINMFIAVVAGAFGAHGLRNVVSPLMLGVWETGVTYHLIHGIALLLIALAMPHIGEKALSLCGTLMLAGIVLFSGSLYLLVLTGVRWIGVITPIGGVAFLAAWAGFAWAAWRAPNRNLQRCDD
ncbi:membrane protein [Robbsia andropogonis]|uniref:Membrane protein n=1 Tax=Robbsia andropogonis TaxID=28092 RepID=A0A0F5JV91_9BURK|nr:DUF423 domain-containing protein [Robbsia andropogonis]KKB61783.1 membrane protein [Robbsia andropogonis]MCP1121128.1 DUF423 domain-containing protein [Robbsia andropogonis]MCP1130921.1 DUF423 domain-containing protein [Robbsia andropogonis]